MIKPKTLKGFRDSLPSSELIKQKLIFKISDIFRTFGYVPIDTPALEYTEVLLGKGGGETDKQVFRFSDNGQRDVALRFDLTVPLARYVAANEQMLCFPFKRYHIAKVWRGEKPQKGRYREFTQCDFDIIGANNCLSDFETILVICECLEKIGVSSFKIHISHKALTFFFLKSLGLESKSDSISRIIDKIGKIGTDAVKTMLTDSDLTENQIKSIIDYISLPHENYSQTLFLLSERFGSDNPDLQRLQEIGELAKKCLILDKLVIDTSIMRGLDYYTGLVFETFLLDLPNIGSICSGGRYDKLTALYSSHNYSSVGACIGIDRLLAALQELDSSITDKTNSADFLVLSDNDFFWSEETAQKLRQMGLKTNCYLGNKSRGAQFAYAQANNIKYVICSGNENGYSVKDIENDTIIENIPLSNLIKLIK